MRIRLPRNRYTVGLATCLLLIFGPVIFWLLLSLPSLVYPNDCDIAARCQHSVVQMAQSLGFGLIFLGPVSMLFGALGIVILAAIWGIRAFKSKNSDRSSLKYTKQFIGLVCGGTLAYLLYIPSGPDPCSREITDTKYEQCVEEIFLDMSVVEARQWLETYGYRLTEVRPYTGGFTAATNLYARKQTSYQHDFIFNASRDYGNHKSVPYGTNFNRLFARIGPAPENFKLYLFGVQEDDIVFGVKADWAFSFL